MKNVKWVIATILIILSFNANAQTKKGFDYFSGKWNVYANSPTGDVTMVVEFVKNSDIVTASIKDDKGNEMYKVVKTTVKDTQAVVNFEGSQGEVAMVLDRKDEDHLSGDIMGGMVTVSGERITEGK